MDEAARLVDEAGRERLTLSELAKRFGVAQPSLYKHVKGLDGLNRLLAVRVLREVGETMRRASSGKAREDAVSAVAVAYRAYALAHPGRYGYIVRAPAPGDEALEAAAREILSILDDVFAGYGIRGADAVDDVRLPRVHDVGGADPSGELELDRVDVDRDHRMGTDEGGTDDGREADAPGPEHGERTTGRPVHDVEDCPDAGDHRARRDGGDLRRYAVRDRQHARL